MLSYLSLAKSLSGQRFLNHSEIIHKTSQAVLYYWDCKWQKRKITVPGLNYKLSVFDWNQYPGRMAWIIWNLLSQETFLEDVICRYHVLQKWKSSHFLKVFSISKQNTPIFWFWTAIIRLEDWISAIRKHN